MFFCNPYKETDRKEGDNGGAIQVFRFLINHHNFPWIPSLDTSKSPDLEPAASFSNGSASTCESTDDFIPNVMFHDASSGASTIFRERIHPTTQLQRIRFRRLAKVIFVLCCLSLGVFVLGQYGYNDTSSLKSSIKNATKGMKSGAVRIWNGAVPSSSKLMEIMGVTVGIIGKIPWAISSLFQWDEVDDAIVDWTKRAIRMIPTTILRILSETVTFTIYPALPSTQTVTTKLSRIILRTIDEFNGVSATGAQQALAVLDFLQDTEL